MQIITGKTGTNHVAAADDRALHAATFGIGNYVLNVGSKFNTTIETSNNIVIDSGDLVINGTHARIPHGETDTVIIENGTTGYNRIDLIVARYTKTSGLESVELAVIKGETTSGTPTRPSYTEGNVLEDVEIAEMPLYAVQLAGVNVASITPLFTVSTGLDDVYRKGETYTKDEVNSIEQELQTNINTAQSTANEATQKLSEHSEVIGELVNDVGHANEACNNLQDNINYVYNKLCIPIGCGIISKSNISATVFQYGDWETFEVTFGDSGITYKLHIRIA